MSVFRTLALSLIGSVALGLILSGCGEDRGRMGEQGNGGRSSSLAEAHQPWHPNPDATFVGAGSCRACHEEAFQDWSESDHHKAMEPATEETVLGDFDDAAFEHYGHVTRFFRKGDEFWVNAEDEDGERQDFKVEYTFGFYPLQQYLIPFPDGRYQALQVCWDSRPEEEGGQRWYHLYPDEAIPPEDELHWTRQHFNWNYMCADCHSTNLRKNYDFETKSYATAWSEMNVSCEACHGPGSEHVNWALHEAAKTGGDLAASEREEKEGTSSEALSAYLNKGLVVDLKEPEQGGWAVDPESGQPHRTVELASTVQVETCARCHSHRQLLQEHHVHGHPYLDGYSPSVLSDRLYHHDGQIDEEVYVYGSFVQSKMYHAGVRCTDCHHHHTMKPLAKGNNLCTRCHLPTKYDSPQHHFHPPGSPGASCVECHMPTKNYMVVDPRRDHSLRVPRPDLAAELGTPDACTQCHQEEGRDWVVAAFKEHWGGLRNAHYGEMLAEGRRGTARGLEQLRRLAADLEQPALVRASALESLVMQAPDRDNAQAAIGRFADPDPVVRQQALRLLEMLPGPERLSAAAPLLSDPSRVVRCEAARVLAAARGVMSAQQAEAFEAARAEFETKQRAIADRAAGHVRLAMFYSDLGDLAQAEESYRNASRVDPSDVPSRVNLSELLFEQGRFEECEAILREGLELAPSVEQSGIANEALARFLIRQKRYDEGVEYLKVAAEKLPRHARTQYFLGVALNSLGRFGEALPYLERAADLDPRNPEYLIGVATVCRDAGEFSTALDYVDRLLRLDPSNPQYQALHAQISGLMRQDPAGR